ncbi:hypothetical protein EVJ58_g1774 [Rhodofomes roseus]|uniref:Uncharacterized protein n=1 Tax=Rhodofomes roseus TaxID=34475 RepID=A0A4Y9YXV0_9APHY|nr:hypothetical protein EVJ58_g1774 [Rhodofomes roseus]
MASTSSYDYWWPYPAWGATTAEGAATAVPLASTPAPSLVTISVTDSALSSVVHPVATSSASTTSSGSIIRITALPPSNGTSSQKSTAYSHSGFDIAYLAPLFAVLAAIAGALFTWYLLRWQVRRRDKQGHGSSILHSGPRYAPPPGFTEDSAPQGSSSSGSATESSKLLRGRTDSKKEGWLARAFSRSSRHSQAMSAAAPVTPISVVGRQLSSRVPRTSMNNLYSAVEDDANSEDAGAMPMDSNGPERSGTRLPGQIASPELLSPGDDDVPYDTLRHKSIRRAIMERLKFGSLRRPAKDKAEYLPDVETGRVPGTPVRRVSSRRGHRRNDPDFNVEDLQRAGSAGNPSRATSLMREMAGRPPILSPPGFRIIEEDTEADMHGADHEHGHLLGRDRLEDGSEGGTPARENPAWKWIASWSPSPSIRTVRVGTPRISTTLETFPSIALRLSSERGVETPLRSAPVPVTASRYVNGEATVDIGMAPYESWTGKRSRKHSRASKMIFGVLGLAALASPLSPTPNNALSPTYDPRAPCSAHTPIFSPWLQSLRVHSVDPLTSPWLPNRRGSDGLWAFPQSPRGVRC